MTTPMPNSTSDFRQLGALVGDYPASGIKRIIYVVAGTVALLLAISGSVPIGSELIIEFDGFWRVLFVVMAVACALLLYSGYGSYAKVFTQGFVYSEHGKLTACRWEEIAKVNHKITQSYTLSFIPDPWKSHSYTIILKNGKRVNIDGSYLSRSRHLGDTIQRMWSAFDASQDRVQS